MAASNTLTTLDEITKIVYPETKIMSAIFRNHPLLQLLPKDYSQLGKLMHWPVAGAGGSPTSGTASTAFANYAATTEIQFQAQPKYLYQAARLDGPALQLVQTHAAYVDAVKYVMDRSLKALEADIASSLFKNTDGVLAQVATSSGISGSTITLQNIEESVRFRPNDILVLSGDGSTWRTGTVTVSSVDHSTGVITCSAAVTSGISAAADGDYIARSGTTSTIAGLEGYLPYTAPSSGENFLGADRSSEPEAFAGIRKDGSNLTRVEALNALMTDVARFGYGTPDLIVVNPVILNDLCNELESQVTFAGDKDTKRGIIGFEYLKHASPAGVVKIVADRFCNPDYGYALDLSTWKLYAKQQLPHIIKDDGLTWARVAGDDVNECRFRAIYLLKCDRPGSNGVVRFNAS